MTTEQIVKPTLKQFFLRALLWNLLITLAFSVILFTVWGHYVSTKATRTDFLFNLIALPLCWTHSILLLIFSMRRFSKKQVVPGLLFFVHFVLSGILGYYLYVILALFGWAYTMKSQ